MERRNRIFGIETEFGVAVWDGRRKTFSDNDLAVRFIDFAVGVQNQYLENGARVYLDIGSHIETATPECDSALQAALYDKALEKAMACRVKEFNRGFSQRKFILLKNNADFGGRSYGCHENYLVPSDLWYELAFRSPQYLSRMFQLFLAVRPILCGSGCVTDDMRFLFSRRATFIRCVTGTTTQSERPIIHQKNESLAGDGSGLSRLHLLIADSNMSDFSVYLRMGATHLVLLALERLIREKMPIKSSMFSHQLDVVRLLREVNEDISFAKRYPIGLIRQASACDIHRLIIDFVYETIHDIIFPEEKEIMARWLECVEKIEEGDEDYLSCRLDWAIKKRLMERKLERWDIDPAILRARRIIGAWHARPELTQLQMLDLTYHDISAEGIYNQLAERGAVEKILDDREIEKAKTIPPETRAAWRGGIIRYFNERLKSDADFDLRHECWMQISVVAKREAVKFINTDPYEKNWHHAKDFMDRLAN